MGCKVFKFFCKNCYLSDLKSIFKILWSFQRYLGCGESKLGSIFFKYHEVQNWKSKTYLKDTCRPENGKLFRPTDRRVLPYFQYVEHLVAEITDDLVNRRPRKKLVISNPISRVFSSGWCTTNSWFDNFFKGFDGSIMQLDNPIIYFVKLYMNC